MSKSRMEDVAAAVWIVNSLDRRGRLVILRDLQKQDLEPKKREIVTCMEAQEEIAKPEKKKKEPVDYTEGGTKR